LTPSLNNCGRIIYVSFDEAYFDGITQALFLGGEQDEVPEKKLIVKVMNRSRGVRDFIMDFLEY
jgi:hypothetical protein